MIMLTWATISSSSIGLIIAPTPLFTRLLTNGPRNLQTHMLVSGDYSYHFDLNVEELIHPLYRRI